MSRRTHDIDEGTLKDVLALVKLVVENSSLDKATSLIKRKLNKIYGGNFDIIAFSYGRCMIYWIGGIKGIDAVLDDGKWCKVEKGVDIENLSTVEKMNLPAYKWGLVEVHVGVTESFNLLNLALRKVLEIVKDRESVQTLEIPDEVKDIMNNYWRK